VSEEDERKKVEMNSSFEAGKYPLENEICEPRTLGPKLKSPRSRKLSANENSTVTVEITSTRLPFIYAACRARF